MHNEDVTRAVPHSNEFTRVVPYAPVEQSETIPRRNGLNAPAAPAAPRGVLADMLGNLAKQADREPTVPAASFDALMKLHTDQAGDNRRLQTIVEKLFWDERNAKALLERKVDALNQQLDRARIDAAEAREALHAQRTDDALREAMRNASATLPAIPANDVSPFDVTQPRGSPYQGYHEPQDPVPYDPAAAGHQ